MCLSECLYFYRTKWKTQIDVIDLANMMDPHLPPRCRWFLIIFQLCERKRARVAVFWFGPGRQQLNYTFYCAFWLIEQFVRLFVGLLLWLNRPGGSKCASASDISRSLNSNGNINSNAAFKKQRRCAIKQFGLPLFLFPSRLPCSPQKNLL